MAKRLDQIMVIDIECTCWEKATPPGEQTDIIEIGICMLDLNTLRRTHKESILVKPERSTVSEFCTRLTTLTQEQVESGIPFTSAIEKLRREYLAHERAWASYGDFDRRQFERQCRDFNLPYPFGSTHLNIKNLIALVSNSPYEVGLAEAMKQFGLPLEGTHHRGADDAWNIAALFSALLNRFRNGANHGE